MVGERVRVGAQHDVEEQVGEDATDLGGDDVQAELLRVEHQHPLRVLRDEVDGALLHGAGLVEAEQRDEGHVLLGDLERAVEVLAGVDRGGVHHCISCSRQMAKE